MLLFWTLPNANQHNPPIAIYLQMYFPYFPQQCIWNWRENWFNARSSISIQHKPGWACLFCPNWPGTSQSGKCGERKSKGWFFTFSFSKMWKILWKLYQMHQTHSLRLTLGKLLSNTFKRASSGEEKVKVFLSFQVCDWKCLCKWEKVSVIHCQIGVQLSTVNACKLVSSDREKVKVFT